MALQAIGRSERLALMGLEKIGILGDRGNPGKAPVKPWSNGTGCPGGLGAGLMGHMAHVAAHIQRSMAAALLGHVHPRLMAAEAEVLFSPEVGFRS